MLTAFTCPISGVDDDGEVLEWSSDPPVAPGRYLWTERSRVCLFQVEYWGADTPGGKAKLTVRGNVMPVSEYSGEWIGPIGERFELLFPDTERYKVEL